MPAKVLRRCSICGKFHASYLVQQAQSENKYYCYSCWKARFDESPDDAQAPAGEGQIEQGENGQTGAPQSSQ